MLHKTIIYSRHPSHRILRTNLPQLNVRSLVRLGSVTEPKTNVKRVEINSIESIKISSNKRLMKKAFNKAGCPTPLWTDAKDLNQLINFLDKEERIKFPSVAKHIHGSRGTGNSLIHDKTELKNWAHGKDFSNYIFENYVGYKLEFRLHVTRGGCFYTCRKALIKDTEQAERWRRHKDNSVWLLETNPDFNKPNSWEDIVQNCINALKEVGADLLSFDVKVQSSLDKEGKKRKYQDFILIECNSASSLQSPAGKKISVCASKYLEVIPQLIKAKNEGLYEK